MEKKQIKMSLGTFIAIIVAIILVVVVVFMGIHIANQNKQIEESKVLVANTAKEETTKNNTNTKANISNSNSTVTNEQKMPDISNEKILEMAKATIEKYEKLEIYQSSSTDLGAMPYILDELGLETRDNVDKLLVNFTGDRNTYIKSNTKYIDFKSEMLKYVTEELFNKEYSNYKNIDDYVGIQDVGVGIPTNDISSLELISKNGNEYTFKVIMIDSLAYDNYLNGDTIADEDYLQATAVCKYINGYLVVSEMHNNI